MEFVLYRGDMTAEAKWSRRNMSPTTKLKPAILIVSETAAKDPSSDRSSGILKDLFALAGGTWEVPLTKIVPDDVREIQSAVRGWTDTLDEAVDLVVTSGGTGFAEKDVTPEAISSLLHKHASGLVHGMLAASSAVTPFGLMSRPVAGVRHKTLVVTVPGSPKGAKENLEAILKLLPHACQQAAGENSRQLHAGGIEKLEKEAGVSAQHSHKNTQQSGHGHHRHHHHHKHDHGSHQVPQAHTDPSHLTDDPSLGPARRLRASPYPMLAVEEALTRIADSVPATFVITCPLSEAVGHVLAEDVKAIESVPAFCASIVDGYAVRMSGGAATNAKGVFPVAFSSHAHAGDVPTLQEGQIARITTGAAVPRGANAVVMVEDTILASKTADGQDEAEIEILTDQAKAGENIREIGSDVQAGDVVMRKGEGISALGGEFGLLASVAVQTVKVFKKPRVGVLSTGDEIVPYDRPDRLKLGEVRDTNRPSLLMCIRARGFEAVDLGIASDKADRLEACLREGLQKVDVLITSGGVSMGEFDLLKPTIERSLGGTIRFGRVSMKPGKPTTFATVPTSALGGHSSSEQDGFVHPPDDLAFLLTKSTGSFSHKLIFSLPGNPASAVVTFLLFALPALQQMSGVHPLGLPRVLVRLETSVSCDPKREEYARVVVLANPGAEGLWATSTGGQRSSRIASFKSANALLKLPAGGGLLEKGAVVEALLMTVPDGV